MRDLGGWRLAVAGVLLVASTSAGRAADEARPGNPVLDKRIYDVLRDIINTGADLFNNHNEILGCYRLYQGSLMSIRPLLADHPDLQDQIERALADTEKMTSLEKRARALNTTLQEVRKKLKPAGSAVPDVPKTKPSVAKPPIPMSLWDRLGGEVAVRKVVDDLSATAAADPKVNLTRNGKYKLNDAAVTNLKQMLVELVSSVTGGPLKYTGKDMKEVHKGMGITNAEFDALAADLRKALEKNGVKAAEVQDLLKIVGTTRSAIVEEKKPDEKPGTTKPEDKKPDRGTKPADKTKD
jgi:hemoglobin